MASCHLHLGRYHLHPSPMPLRQHALPVPPCFSVKGVRHAPDSQSGMSLTWATANLILAASVAPGPAIVLLSLSMATSICFLRMQAWEYFIFHVCGHLIMELRCLNIFHSPQLHF